jgi:ribonucleotide monophosphatase NagD (HAD superfamily)
MKIKSVLIDIAGVLHVDYIPIKPAIQGLQLLKSNGLKIRFVTNTDLLTRDKMIDKLRLIGFSIETEEVTVHYSIILIPCKVFTSPMAARTILQKHNVSKPCFLIHPELVPEFSDYQQSLDQKYDSVVLGDMQHHLHYTLLNNAFRVLMENDSNLYVIMGGSRYYKDETGLSLDVGSISKSLEV